MVSSHEKSGKPTDTRARIKRSVLIAAFSGHLVATLLLLYLPSTLLIHAETGGGRLVGGSFVLLLCASMSPWLLRFRRARLPSAIAAGLLLVGGLSCLLGASAIAPTGVIPAGNFTQWYAGSASFDKRALPNVVPEIDQLKLGSYLFPHLDPFIDRKQGARIRRLFLDIYGEMRRDEAFVQAGSALGMCYEDILRGKRRTLHFYEYVPRHLARERYPVLVFLHGSLGNFKGYTWVMKGLADSEGYAVIAPTYGCGNWYLDRDSSVSTEVYEHCVREPALDQDTIYLAGLSNGGTGVTREIRAHGDRYRGFVLISPVIESQIVASADFVRNSARKPFLIIHGDDDRRIPAEWVRAREGILRSQGLSVTSRYYPREDHFVFFSQRASVIRDIADWLPEATPQ
jgi:pimeloyl-ACP methyl ester carboxylesterase